MGRIGPSWLPMSSYFCAVRQTWRACPSVFVGLCSLKSLGECLGVISASCLPASLLPHLSPRSALSLTWTRSLYGWRRNMIKTSSWADSKSCWGEEGGGQSDCIMKVMRRAWKISGTRQERLCQMCTSSALVHFWVGMMTSGERPLFREESTPMKLEQGCLTQLTNKGLEFDEAVKKPLLQQEGALAV